MNRPTIIRFRVQPPRRRQLDASSRSSPVVAGSDISPPPYKLQARAKGPRPPFPPRQPLRHHQLPDPQAAQRLASRINSSNRHSPTADAPNLTHPTISPQIIRYTTMALEPSKALLEDAWRKMVQRVQMEITNMQVLCNSALSREENLRVYCMRLRSERDRARQERNTAREKVKSLVEEMEGLRSESRMFGLKRARDANCDDGGSSGGDCGLCSSTHSSDLPSTSGLPSMDPYPGSPSPFLHPVSPLPSRLSSSLTDATLRSSSGSYSPLSAGSPRTDPASGSPSVLLRPISPLPLRLLNSFPTTASPRRSVSEPWSPNREEDSNDLDLGRSPKRRRKSVELGNPIRDDIVEMGAEGGQQVQRRASL